MKYDPKAIEKKWQEKWSKSSLYLAKNEEKDKKKKYILVEFPYPSGEGLHVGHAFIMTGADVYTRYHRMLGYNVLFPMGWDAFGLPAENYAIKHKVKPQDSTKKNTDRYKEQMNMLAFSFDWTREVNTTDPNYYHWTQWIFSQLFKKGLAYKKSMPINWCPSCKIGLANEEVVNGKCERCGAETSRREISQWIVKITDYADRLIEGLERTDFVEKVKKAQINWIDRKEWIDITYEIEGQKDTVTVATTRPDTNFGATFIVLAPEHELVSKLLSGEIKTDQNIDQIKDYVAKARNKSELDRQMEVVGRQKTGVFTGLYAINQLTNKKMPIWITDFVLMSVGTGAVVGVPAHDMRDFEFATQFGLEVIRVVVGKNGENGDIKDKNDVQEAEGTMINSGFLDGLDIHEATKKIMDYLEEKGWGKRSTRYHLRDWIFSRQHYWGEPIPMIYCEECATKGINYWEHYGETLPSDEEIVTSSAGWFPVDDSELPITLPEVDHYEPTETGESPLANMKDWVATKCPVCGKPAKRETDTMPNWAGSDWYYMRYLDPKNQKAPADMDLMKYWMPVDVYIGGDEHNTLHMLYSRFIYKFLYDIKAVPNDEPYHRRVSHGVILGPDNQRMSKSHGNVIVPDEVAERVGVDATRAYFMFMGPFDGTMAWNDSALMGVRRFVERLYNYITDGVNDFGTKDSDEIAFLINQLTKDIRESIASFGFNSCIAKFMEALNVLDKADKKTVSKDSIKKMVILIAPFMPYVAEELWELLGENFSVHEQMLPEVDMSKLTRSEIEIPVQFNGKLRGKIKISREITEEDIVNSVKSDTELQKYLEEKEIAKVIYIKEKILNIIIK